MTFKIKDLNTWSLRLSVRTAGFHPAKGGSIPPGTAIMKFFVYILISKLKNSYVTYVGYTNDIKKRLYLHNNGKGAKFTRGKNWVLIYRKKYKDKSTAMKEEYKLKNNRIFRNKIKSRYINKL